MTIIGKRIVASCLSAASMPCVKKNRDQFNTQAPGPRQFITPSRSRKMEGPGKPKLCSENAIRNKTGSLSTLL
jgi:hypothetical protein